MTILCYHNFLESGQLESIDEYRKRVTFKHLDNFQMIFTFVEGILCADVTPLLQAIKKQGVLYALKENTMSNRIGRHWTLTDLDPPSNLLQFYKMIPNLSKAQIHRLDLVHSAVKSMWSPSKDDLKTRVHDEFGEVSFGVDDIDLYFSLFPDINAIKGKTQMEETHHESNLKDMDKGQVLLSCDVMWTGNQPYLVGVINSPEENNQISNIFAEAIPSESAKDITDATVMIGNHVKEVLGFRLKVEFDNSKGNNVAKDAIAKALGCEVELVSNHVDYAEAAIKMIKQRVRTKNSALVYDLNATILMHIVIGAILIINKTSRKGNGKRSAHKVLNPHKKVNFKSFYAFSPSDLVEVTTHTSNDTRNLRTTTAVPLHPSISDNNDWLFYSLETGATFTRDYKLAKKVPWTHEARLRMKYLASLDPVTKDDEWNIQATPLVPVNRFEMTIRYRAINTRRRHRMTHEMNGPEPENDENPIALFCSSYTDDHEDFFDYAEHIHIENDDHIIQWDPSVDVGVYPVSYEASEVNLRGMLMSTMMSDSELLKMNDKGDEFRFRDNYDLNQGVLANGSILSVHNDHEFTADDSYATVVTYAGKLDGVLFATQVSAKKARETFGDAGVQAIEKEISSLLQKKVFSAVLKSSLTESQRKKVIRMSCFVRDKVDAQGRLLKIKARLVAGGHMQDKSIYSSNEISSPTVSISSVFSIISCGISEGRRFMKFDISTAYLNAEMPHKDEVFMTLDKQMSELLMKCDSTGEFKDTADSRGQITVQLKKALYGCVQSAKLLYNHLSKVLKELGFEANPVDPCVFNRMSASGKQCTLAMHVDDGLATCEDLEELELLDKQIKERFNNEVDSEVNCTNFDYLGIAIDTKDGSQAELTMKNYIKEVCEEHGEKGKAATPAADNLFKLNDDAERLDKSAAERFHRAVAQLLYLATRVRPDILLPITFLCSRVSEPTHDDLEKLHRVMKYLNGTSHLGIVLGKYGQDMALTVYADASYAVHKDCKSHGGIVVYLHRGPVYVKCAKHKMVSKSSTEAELITLSDAVSIAAYNVNFLKAQGYNVCAELKQDNTSTMKLAENGKSNSDRTKHIQVRFFFVKQYLDDKVMKISHCPTKEMIADICTKPLQGEQFRVLRDMLLGYV